MILLTLILVFSLLRKGKFNLVLVFNGFFKKLVLLTNRSFVKAGPLKSKAYNE